ncbi:MAG: P-II family nitrogen regulator [Nitrospirae bacterium]|nr:P-II family nitrogen regulator [Nitrospirota bacterium]
MKEIIAVIRPSQAFITKKNLQSDGFPAYTSMRVLGRSRQRGLRYAPRSFFFWRRHGDKVEVQFVPKLYISLIVADRDVSLVVQSLIRSNQSGKIGDGKIFVLPVEEALQIRNQFTGDRCLQ